MALGKWEGAIVVPTGGWTFNLIDNDHGGGGATATIAAGTYYLTSPPASSLLTTLKAALDDGAGVTYTVSVDDNNSTSNGKVTITPSAGTFSVTWTSTDLRDVLGFQTNITASSGATGTEHAEYLWLPDVPRSSPMSPEPVNNNYDMGAYEEDGTFSVSPGGAVRGLAYTRRIVDRFKYTNMRAHKVFEQHEQNINESLQNFYKDVIFAKKNARFHPDREDNTVYFTWVIDSSETGFQPVPFQDGWVSLTSLWSIDWKMYKAV